MELSPTVTDRFAHRLPSSANHELSELLFSLISDTQGPELGGDCLSADAFSPCRTSSIYIGLLEYVRPRIDNSADDLQASFLAFEIVEESRPFVLEARAWLQRILGPQIWLVSVDAAHHEAP